jgi:hypothetical protein
MWRAPDEIAPVGLPKSDFSTAFLEEKYLDSKSDTDVVRPDGYTTPGVA